MTYSFPSSPVTVDVFSTVHGSHLYGLEHADSDQDVFTVTTSTAPRARQHIRLDGTDTAVVGFDAFVRRAISGSHQSVEALFSPYQQWSSHLELQPYLRGLRIGGAAVAAKYERTILAFSGGDYKKRRHAARLSLNLDQLRRHGRFCPVLNDLEKDYVSTVADLHGDRLLDELFENLPRFGKVSD